MQITTELKFGSILLRINWIVAFFVLVTFGAFIRLGLWQLDRAQEKVALQEELQLEQQKQAVAIEELQLLVRQNKTHELSNLHVSLEGEYINEHAILLVSKFFNDKTGYEVVTPFKLKSNGQLVLVNRGWISVKPNARAQLDLRPVSGFQHLTAQIQVPSRTFTGLSNQIDTSAQPIRMRHLDVDLVSGILQEKLFPFSVRLTENQPGVLVRNWPAVEVNINTNLGYALQWFLFALLVLVTGILMSSNILSLLRE
ncbi:MAG: SURF1 family protein [bacterium]|nr:SURF1 family protein [Gammaproteobacteria bacterium]